MKLYIFGNGFDLAHKLPTKFENFIDSNKVYKNKYKMFKEDDWNHIENNIAKIILERKQEIEDYIEFLDVDEITSYIISSYGLDKYGHVAYHGYEEENIKELLHELQDITKLILDLETDFKEYLKTNIKYEIDVIEKYLKLNFENSLIVSFNYTSTLEKVYNIKNVQHIHGSIDDNIKIGYNSDVSIFNTNTENLNYPKYEEIIVESKHDLVERYIRYDDELDEYGNPTGNVHENPVRLDFHNRVKDDITTKNNQIKTEIKLNDKSLFNMRQEVVNLIKGLTFKEIVIIGHSLGEMDHDFFDLIFEKSNNIKCGYFDCKDLQNKRLIANNKEWTITFTNDF